MILSDERFDALLDGDEPRDEIERQWITNYRAEQEKRRKERELEDQKRLQERQQAYREYYALIKSTFPKSFFYKNPISDEEYEAFEESYFNKYESKITLILNIPLIRALYRIPSKHPSGDDYSQIRFLEDKFMFNEIKKKYGIDFFSKNKEYNKYMTKEFREKAEKISKKYKTYIVYTFDIYDYLTDWQRYNV